MIFGVLGPARRRSSLRLRNLARGTVALRANVSGTPGFRVRSFRSGSVTTKNSLRQHRADGYHLPWAGVCRRVYGPVSQGPCSRRAPCRRFRNARLRVRLPLAAGRIAAQQPAVGKDSPTAPNRFKNKPGREYSQPQFGHSSVVATRSSRNAGCAPQTSFEQNARTRKRPREHGPRIFPSTALRFVAALTEPAQSTTRRPESIPTRAR